MVTWPQRFGPQGGQNIMVGACGSTKLFIHGYPEQRGARDKVGPSGGWVVAQW